MRLNSAALVSTVLAAAVLLTACTSTEPTPTSTPVASPTPTPVPVEPLDCDALVAPDLAAYALEGAGGPEEAVLVPSEYAGRDAFRVALLEGVGGLSCTWRVGSGMPEYNPPSDWAYLTVSVLPGAAGQWAPIRIGDGVSDQTALVAGIEASVAAGDPGLFLSAPVGDAWVDLSIGAAAWNSTGGRFVGRGGAPAQERLAEVAAPVFTTLQAATPEQLAWPALATPSPAGECDTLLDAQALAAAIPEADGAALEVVSDEPSSIGSRVPFPPDFDDVLLVRAGGVGCTVQIDGRNEYRIAVVRQFGSLINRLRQPDADTVLTTLVLNGDPARSTALVESAAPYSGYLAAGDDLYEVDAPGKDVEPVIRALAASAG